jgi:hypothetical protein
MSFRDCRRSAGARGEAGQPQSRSVLLTNCAAFPFIARRNQNYTGFLSHNLARGKLPCAHLFWPRSDRSDRMGQTDQAQTPVQPERTPRQSEQSRDQERNRAEDVRVGRGWRTQGRDDERSDRMGYNDMGRTRDQTVGRNWRTRPDDDRADRDGYGRGYYDEDRPRRRVKVCVEYADGDEYCRYKD